MSVYVGIDVHRKRSRVAVATEDGGVQLNRNVVNGAEAVLRLIGGLPAGTPVAFEAAFGWGWLVQLLEDYGFEAHLVHPLRCKAIASARLKNDKGRRGDAGPVAARGSAARGVDRPAAGAAAAGAAAAPGQPGAGGHPGAQPDPRGGGGLRVRPGRGWLAELDLPPVSRRIVTDSLTLIDALEVIIGQLDAQVRAWAKADPRVKTLTDLPGVGVFTAMVMLAEIGDITRFANARKLASWAGLTPTVRGSDRTVRHGHISKQGSVWLRWVLNQAAQTAKRSPEFAPAYTAIAARRGTKIVTMAVARKLLARACHLLAAQAANTSGAAADPTDREGHQPRVSSLRRHEPASGRARSSD